MNALNNISDEAKVIVTDLATKQVNDMKAHFTKYQEWIKDDGGVIRYGKVCQYTSIQKFVYMTEHKTWGGNSYLLPITYTEKDAYKAIKNNNYLTYSISNLESQLRLRWEEKYMESFITSNMFKLQRALAKHLTNDMVATSIVIRNGNDGAEVNALVDGKQFVTYGTLCGGDIQCLHYRYRSSLK
jgi:hypothetical protein